MLTKTETTSAFIEHNAGYKYTAKALARYSVPLVCVLQVMSAQALKELNKARTDRDQMVTELAEIKEKLFRIAEKAAELGGRWTVLMREPCRHSNNFYRSDGEHVVVDNPTYDAECKAYAKRKREIKEENPLLGYSKDRKRSKIAGKRKIQDAVDAAAPDIVALANKCDAVRAQLGATTK